MQEMVETPTPSSGGVTLAIEASPDEREIKQEVCDDQLETVIRADPTDKCDEVDNWQDFVRGREVDPQPPTIQMYSRLSPSKVEFDNSKEREIEIFCYVICKDLLRNYVILKHLLRNT